MGTIFRPHADSCMHLFLDPRGLGRCCFDANDVSDRFESNVGN